MSRRLPPHPFGPFALSYAAFRDSADVPRDAAADVSTASAVDAAPIRRRRRRVAGTSRRAALLWLLLITAVGGVLRFSSLDAPPVWGDEAMTFSRTIGSYGELLGVLREDGFTPYHYELTWWLRQGCPLPWPTGNLVWADLWSPGGKDAPWHDWQVPLPEVTAWQTVGGGVPLTPFYLRLVPAICGTLMVPAVYFLAAQMARRKVALVAALFACCSAWLLNYSRDAKMYQQSWLFVTLHLGCFLWWLRLRRQRRYSRPAWWLWVAGGIAMTGFSAPSAAVLGVELVLFLTAPAVRWGSADHLGLPLAAVAALPTWACLPLIALPPLLAWASGWSWTAFYVLVACWLVVPLAATVTRRFVVKASVPENALRARFSGRVRLARQTPPAEAGSPSDSRVLRDVRHHFTRLGVPDWLPFLLGLLVVGVGLLGYYGIDGRNFSVLPDWLQLPGFNRWAPLMPASQGRRNPWLQQGGIGWVRGYNGGRDMAGHVGYALSAFLTAWEWPRDVDWPKVEPLATTWLPRATLALTTLLLIGLSARPRRDREHRRHGVAASRRLVWLGAAVLLPMWGFWLFSRPAKDVAAAAGALPALGEPWAWPAWVGGLLTQAADELPLTWWLALTAALAGAGAAAAASRSPRGRARRAWRALWPTLVLLGLMLAVWLALAVKGKAGIDSIWMPRYLGFVWPAFAVAVAVLLMRLPTRPVRWGAIALLLGVNLAQHAARVYAGSEPPAGVVAADLLAARDDPAATVFVRADAPDNPDGGPGGTGAPGGGYPFSYSTGYYAALQSRDPWTVRSFRWRGIGTYVANYDNLARSSFDKFAARAAKKANGDAKLRRVIFWTATGPDESADDGPILAALGDRWHRAAGEDFVVRDHWTWERFCVLHRRVYERMDLAQNP